MSESEFCDRWPARAIEAQCRKRFNNFKPMLDDHHRGFFRTNHALAGDHPLKARDLAAALPPGRRDLVELLCGRPHPHYLSGGSSQVLALALLGAPVLDSPNLGWLGTLLDRAEMFHDKQPTARFEAELPAAVLNEYPNATSIDLLIEDANVVVCLEAKYQEKGFGHCSCDESDPGASSAGRCAQKVIERDAYWETAREVFRFRDREDNSQCPIAVSYQAIRNVSTARALSGGRQAVFALVYDERNPYFTGAGEWQGWVTALEQALAPAEAAGQLTFRAFSWQQLLRSGAVDPRVVDWASDKHLFTAVS